MDVHLGPDLREYLDVEGLKEKSFKVTYFYALCVTSTLNKVLLENKFSHDFTSTKLKLKLMLMNLVVYVNMYFMYQKTFTVNNT